MEIRLAVTGGVAHLLVVGQYRAHDYYQHYFDSVRHRFLTADLLDASFTIIRFPQDADLVFRRIPFAFHCLVLS
jgi:hypothetical protein